MFNRLFNRSRKVEMTLKQFELWTNVEIPGMFIVQRTAKCVGTIAARTLEQANKEAPMGCWAVGVIKD